MQKARRHPAVASMGLRPLVGMWFQVHYPPLVGVLPIFRSRYCFAIGRQGVLSLTGWAPSIRTHFHVLSPTQVPTRSPHPAVYRTITVSGAAFQRASTRVQRSIALVLQPHPDESRWFGLVRVRSPLLTESLLLSFPPGSEMFQFPGFATCTYGFSARSFGYLGIRARLTASPSLSQSSTPFLASWRQDIPHTPLVAWPH